MTDEVEGAPGAAPEMDVEVFARHRERLLAALEAEQAVALVAAGPELLRSRDTEVRYRPGTDLYYLTGFPEPEAYAVLSPFEAEHRFTLFVRPRDPEREAWTGERIGVERAAGRYRADAAYPVSELATRLPQLVQPARRVYYPVGMSPELDRTVLDLLVRARRARPRSGSGPTELGDLDAVVGPLRLLKGPEELERMRVAARITERAHRAGMARARPGAGEWEIEAAVDGTMRALGAAGPAFPSIIGSGPNATVLHHVLNDRRVEDGDLVLVDAGAEWGMYCSDLTRTFPASGRFTAPQRELYDVVLRAERAAIDAVRPGAPFTEVHDAAVRVLVEGLLQVGLLPPGSVDDAVAEGGYKRFYMHQTSHWLGLDVHDVGAYREGGEAVRLAPGMVLTVEPGLYVPAADDVPEPYRGIGIRIEDSVLVTDAGHEVLTGGVPTEAEEVEALVGRG